MEMARKAQRAILSVSDKTGIVDFAKQLEKLGIEIISTGGTYKILKENNVNALEVSETTGFPECLDGRVKTLHPKIHGGILAIRDKEEHNEQINNLSITPIDIVVVNLYPFKETILKQDVIFSEIIENIDIGGPTMLRAGAKNYRFVTVIVDPKDYSKVLLELEKDGYLSEEANLKLAAKVFEHTAHYDSLIANHLGSVCKNEEFPETITLTYEKVQDMRYGENPHQRAAFYKEISKDKGTLPNAIKLHGKELSFNNINDTHGALELLKEFDEPTIVACKHGNPCGVGSGKDIYEAYMKAFTSDPVSIYGGIIVTNDIIDKKTALEINNIFVEIVLAKGFTEEALKVLSSKKNIRILEMPEISLKQPENAMDMKKVSGGILIQDIDRPLLNEEELVMVTKRKPTTKEMEDLIFTWKLVKHIKSNGIAIGRDKQSIGIGPGQVNRIWACEQAISHGQNNLGKLIVQGSVLASDAYFPFPDCVEEAYKAGISAIIQPGGSIRDAESIALCNKYRIAMVFTNIRHFKH